MVLELINANPIIYEKKQRQTRSTPSVPNDEYTVEPIDQQEIFDILFTISFRFFCFPAPPLFFSNINRVSRS